MADVSHQTARLTRGKHRSADEGTCVMELASMLAGEPFTDHPQAVCPVVGAVLRTYNDVIDDDRRQDLYRYASASVGTNDRSVRRARLEIAERFFALKVGRVKRVHGGWRLTSVARAVVAHAAVQTDGGHRRFLDFVDQLIAASGSGSVSSSTSADQVKSRAPIPAPVNGL